MQNQIIQQVLETLRGANSVLITVKNSPTVDDLTAAISLTLILNHMGKNATTVFSGQVPSTIEFLQPEMAIEQNTDSLRDFIIALDKAKADKLRYKVEDNVVRIFITPYKSSITEEDLEFSQGELNVDVIVALGVLNKDDFDEAIVAHGRILHDATVVSISSDSEPSSIGTVSWQDNQASGVSEMIAGISDMFGPDVIDNQTATALLTGIVSETSRFKNEKTTPQALAVSSKLMAAGANQQLIAEKLEHVPDHTEGMQPLIEEPSLMDPLKSNVSSAEETSESINIDEDGNLQPMIDEQSAATPELVDTVQERDTQESLEPIGGEGEPLFENIATDSHEDVNNDESKLQVDERTMLSSPGDATTAQLSESDKLTEPSGLFGASMHDIADKDVESDTAEKSSDPESSASTMLEKDDEDSAPIGDSKTEEEPQFILDPIPTNDSSVVDTIPSASDDTVVVDAGEQTINDLEQAVDSPHLENAAEPVSNIDEYMGSVLTPDPGLPAMPTDGQAPKYEAPQAPAPDPVPEPAVEHASEAQPESDAHTTHPQGKTIEELAADMQDSIAKKVNTEVAQSPVAPSVPPPLIPAMPQAETTEPMFYEADGTKSNPFVGS